MPAIAAATRSPTSGRLRKLEDWVIYRDSLFYCMTPSVITRSDGEVMVAFRRAPERRAYGEKFSGHTDPKAQLVLTRTRDGGRRWSDPELIHAHPIGGSQDPCMVQLRDGGIVCTSYAWLRLNVDALSKPPPAFTTRATGDYNFLGGYLLRSENAGKSWEGPFVPPPMPHPSAVDCYGNRVPMFNRGAMCEASDGRLYWAARSLADALPRRHHRLHLLVSSDRGKTWAQSCDIAFDPAISFTETSLIETPRGDLVGFVRGRRLERRGEAGEIDTLQGVPLADHISIVVRSTDRGRSFQPYRIAGFFGFPFHAVRLPDNRVWLCYGYRKPPFGIRARILNPECTNIDDAPEIVLRDDGGTSDVGYPWATLLPDGRVLTVYWINHDDGERYIAGTVCG